MSCLVVHGCIVADRSSCSGAANCGVGSEMSEHQNLGEVRKELHNPPLSSALSTACSRLRSDAGHRAGHQGNKAMRPRILSVLASLVLTTIAAAQSTAFTYQGELKSGGQPASGLHDVRFKLFDAPAAGAQVGSTVCADNVQIVNGRFTATIDFGQQFATPAPRYLEITVRADIGQPCSDDFGYVTLSPRQPLTATPLASHALQATRANSAFSLDAADGSPASAMIVDNNGKIGIGTATPTHNLHIATVGPTIALQDTNAPGQQTGYISFRDSANLERAWVGYGTPGDPDFSIVNARSAGDLILSTLGNGSVKAHGLTATPFGNVGIGTSGPLAPLDVRGEIRFGTSAQYRAAAGEESLRMLRGAVNDAGVAVRGAGYTSARTDVGKYVITFNTPFTGVPSVTATAHRDGLALPSLVVMIDTITTSSVTLIIRYNNNEWADQAFSFIVVGPR